MKQRNVWWNNATFDDTIRQRRPDLRGHWRYAQADEIEHKMHGWPMKWHDISTKKKTICGEVASLILTDPPQSWHGIAEKQVREQHSKVSI